MRGNSHSKRSRASKPLFYSAIPQIVFRDMLPDEEAVRAVQKWHAQQGASGLSVDSVTVAPGASRGEHQARLSVSGSKPVEVSAQTASLAVQRAFEWLQLQAGVMRAPRANGSELAA